MEANIKVAKQITGRDLFKENADVVLLDDNFASLINGIMKSEFVLIVRNFRLNFQTYFLIQRIFSANLTFNNLKKCIAYVLSSSLPKLAPLLLFVLVGLPLPLTTVLILCFDLTTNILPALSLLYEKVHSLYSCHD